MNRAISITAEHGSIALVNMEKGVNLPWIFETRLFTLTIKIDNQIYIIEIEFGEWLLELTKFINSGNIVYRSPLILSGDFFEAWVIKDKYVIRIFDLNTIQSSCMKFNKEELFHLHFLLKELLIQKICEGAGKPVRINNLDAVTIVESQNVSEPRG